MTHYGIQKSSIFTTEFALSSIGSIFAGGLSVGIYMTYSPEMIYYMGGHAPLNIIVIWDEALLDQEWDSVLYQVLVQGP